jgi:hypothetical protein
MAAGRRRLGSLLLLLLLAAGAAATASTAARKLEALDAHRADAFRRAGDALRPAALPRFAERRAAATAQTRAREGMPSW